MCLNHFVILAFHSLWHPEADIPTDRMMDSLDDVFNQMQTELDQGNILNVTVWHGKAHDATSDWWIRFIQRYEDKMGTDHGLSKMLPEGIVDEVCELFEHMEEEYRVTNEIVMGEWQEEFKTYARRWWETFKIQLERG